jgi:hypothetical protein
MKLTTFVRAVPEDICTLIKSGKVLRTSSQGRVVIGKNFMYMINPIRNKLYLSSVILLRYDLKTY